MAKYNNQAARTKAQLEKMKQLEKQGVCAFCSEYLALAEGKVIFNTDGWTVKYNGYPYENTALHLLVIPKQHVKTISELSDAARAEFLDVIKKCEKDFNLSSYSLAMRSGDMRYNGGSVEHLHAHIVVGDTDEPGHEPVRFKMSSQPS